MKQRLAWPQDTELRADRDLFSLTVFIIIGFLLQAGLPQVAAISAVLVAGALGLLAPTAAFWAACAAVPFWQHPVAVGDRSISLLEIAILIAGISALIAIVRIGLSAEMDRLDLAPKWLGVGVLGVSFVIAGGLSILYMPDEAHRSEALRLFRWTIVEPLFVFPAALLAIFRRGARPVATVFATIGSLVSITAILDQLSTSAGFRADDVVRATGPYLHPNNLALFLERVFFLAAAPVLMATTKISRIWEASALIILAGVLATFSRGALLAVLGGWVVLTIIAEKRRALMLGVGVGLGATAVFAVFASDRFGGSTSSGVGRTRIDLWRSGFAMVRDFPVSGIGLDQFLYWHPVRYIVPENWTERYVSHPHNIALDFWLSLGVMGLVTLTLALILLGVAIWNGVWRRPRYSPWQAGAVSALAAGTLHGLLDNSYFLPDLAFLTWVFVALLLMGRRSGANSSHPATMGLRRSGASR